MLYFGRSSKITSLLLQITPHFEKYGHPMPI